MAPENSLAALVMGALAARSDGLEFDVRLAADGTPVVIHDASLARVQGMDVRVEDTDAATLARAGVPMLADVLAAVPPTAFLDVELKVVPTERLTAMLESARGTEPAAAVASSFLPEVLTALARSLPLWPRWLNSDRLDGAVVERAVALDCAGIAAEWRSITHVAARQVRDAGLGLAAFAVRREATVRRLERLGLRFVCVEARPLD
ncbi:MAG: glycerophosphodiester phosphodiesterase [Candidatus Limnocylindrales bacterium]